MFKTYSWWPTVALLSAVVGLVDLRGLSGDDTIFGGAGNDAISGDSGVDAGNGGSGLSNTCTASTETQNNC